MHEKRRNRPVLGSLGVLKLRLFRALPDECEVLVRHHSVPAEAVGFTFSPEGHGIGGSVLGVRPSFPRALPVNESILRSPRQASPFVLVLGDGGWFLTRPTSARLHCRWSLLAKLSYSTGSTITESPWDLQRVLCVRKGSCPLVKLGNIWVLGSNHCQIKMARLMTELLEEDCSPQNWLPMLAYTTTTLHSLPSRH